MRPRVLIVSLTPGWLGPCRIPRFLAEAGVDVHALARPGDFLFASRHLSGRHEIPSGTDLGLALGRACGSVSPALVLPGCEIAVRLLHAIALDERPEFIGGPSAAVRDVVRVSLGDPDGFVASRSKRLTIEVARRAGLRTPEQRGVSGLDDARTFAREHGYPVVLKREFGTAGRGVRICAGEGDLQAAMGEFLSGSSPGTPPGILVQQYIDGDIGTQTVFAVDGIVRERLGGIKVVRHPHPAGPSTIMRLFHDPRVDDAVAGLVRGLGFTGIGSADFMIDKATGTPWLIEFNPRLTPMTHLGRLVGRDLLGALAAWLLGRPYASKPFPESPPTLALFPQERLRDPGSSWLKTHPEDVPEDEPELREALERHARETWTRAKEASAGQPNPGLEKSPPA